MRAVIQRVSACSVSVNATIVGQIDHGLLVLLGVARDDTAADAEYLAQKIVHLRIFEDPQGKMNRSLLDAGGGLLVVSQFTLLGDCRKGRRPSFTGAAPPESAESLYQHFATRVRRLGVAVQTGQFQAHMAVSLTNDGPVTLVLESR